MHSDQRKLGLCMVYTHSSVPHRMASSLYGAAGLKVFKKNKKGHSIVNRFGSYLWLSTAPNPHPHFFLFLFFTILNHKIKLLLLLLLLVKLDHCTVKIWSSYLKFLFQKKKNN